MNYGSCSTEPLRPRVDPESERQSSTSSIPSQVPSNVPAQKTVAVSDEPDAWEISEVTAMLAVVQNGHPEAAADLLKLVYDELRRLAAFRMAQQPPGQTLQPTALVHEAWLKLVESDKSTFKNRAHFFAAAAAAMRCILIDRARRKQTERHGAGLERVALDEFELVSPLSNQQLLDVNDALEQFAREHPIQAKVVELRFFAGMTNEEIAELLKISVSTVKNYWNFSRAWLFQAMEGSSRQTAAEVSGCGQACDEEGNCP